MTRSPRELANQKIQLRKQQETLLRDLLTVADALDRAAEHWQQAEAKHRVAPLPPRLNWWQQLRQRLCWLWSGRPPRETSPSSAVVDVVGSAREGVDLIRQSMLTVLEQHQVVPIESLGQPFDPSQMHALAQQADASVPPNVVVQEVVRGYRWQERMLREAQVIVSATPQNNSLQ